MIGSSSGKLVQLRRLVDQLKRLVETSRILVEIGEIRMISLARVPSAMEKRRAKIATILRSLGWPISGVMKVRVTSGIRPKVKNRFSKKA
ncbi:MAG: hypothetical protein ACJAT6_001727 [Akkermansiaceae bacterium]|jgi:hypothetical protein